MRCAALLLTLTAASGAGQQLSAPVAAALRSRGHHRRVHHGVAAAAADDLAGPPPPWRAQMDRMHSYAASPAGVGGGGGGSSGIGLDVRDYGATGSGVCLEAKDRSWTRCSGPDESAALQQAIDGEPGTGFPLQSHALPFFAKAVLSSQALLFPCASTAVLR